VRDLQLSEFADELREKLRDKGVEVPRKVVLQMTKEFFKHAEEVAKSGDGQFKLWQRDITAIYNILDESRLCNELANGEKVLTADYLISIKKMQKNALRYYKRMPMTLLK